jgi:hypothetical protein
VKTSWQGNYQIGAIFSLTTEIDRRMIDRRMIDRRMVARNQRLRVLSAHESADILVDVIISFGVLYI